MKFFPFFLALLMLNACNDDDFPYDYNKHYSVINKSGQSIFIEYYKGISRPGGGPVPNDSTFSYGLIKDSISNSHILLNSDSVWITFNDNKKLVYKKNQCQTRNIMCENSFTCGTGPVSYVTYCTFTITPEDYKNAK